MCALEGEICAGNNMSGFVCDIYSNEICAVTDLVVEIYRLYIQYYSCK